MDEEKHGIEVYVIGSHMHQFMNESANLATDEGEFNLFTIKYDASVVAESDDLYLDDVMDKGISLNDLCDYIVDCVQHEWLCETSPYLPDDHYMNNKPWP